MKSFSKFVLGIVSLAFSTSVFAADSFDVRVSNIRLLQARDVQNDMKVTEAQRKRLNVAADAHSARIKAFQESLVRAQKDLSRVRVDDPALIGSMQKLKNDVVAVLSSAQLRRLREITLQQAGVRAFVDTDVAKQLGLTAAQNSKLKSIFTAGAQEANQLQQTTAKRALAPYEGKQPKSQAEADSLRAEAGKAYQTAMKGIQARLQSIGTRTESAMNAVLTAAQRGKWGCPEGSYVRGQVSEAPPMCAGTLQGMTLTEKFAELSARGEKALVLFLTAGDQPLEQLGDILDALVEGGADVIELGLPFSDPFGEGPTIQQSSQRALDQGASAKKILSALSMLRPTVPIVTMGYYNPVLRMGLDSFAGMSVASGATGTIVSDLVPDESDDWCVASANVGLETIFLVAPTSSPDRITEAARRSTGFVYVVSRTGVTGAENQVPADVSDLVQRVKGLTSKPVCVGFGISKPEHVRMVCSFADGAVVGSYLVNLLHREWNDGAGRDTIVNAVRELKAATRA